MCLIPLYLPVFLIDDHCNNQFKLFIKIVMFNVLLEMTLVNDIYRLKDKQLTPQYKGQLLT